MALYWNVGEAQLIIPHSFRDVTLLQRALTAGDSNSDDREGHRGLAQVGDALMNFVIMSEGFDRGILREKLQETSSLFKSKKMCSTLARAHGFDRMIKISERQGHVGPQPTTLKNTLAAIVAAVWQDSRSYHAIVKVMTFLGLINYAEPSISPQELAITASAPSFSTGSSNIGHNLETSGSVFDAFLDIDKFGPEETLTTSHAEPFNNRFSSDPVQLPYTASESGQSPIAGEVGTAMHGSQPFLDDTTSVPSVSSPMSIIVEFERAAAETNHVAVTSHQEVNINGIAENIGDGSVDLTSPSTTRACEERCIDTRMWENQHSTEHLLSAGAENPVRLVLEAYVTRELQKLQHEQPEVFFRHYGHMDSYQQALSSVKTVHSKALADMAVLIGDCSAMIILKQAIVSIRSPLGSDSFHIRQDMSPEQHLDAILHLDLRMAHLRLARWLHIYKLCECSSRQVHSKDVDGFVILTTANIGQSLDQPRTAAPRGNPRNREQANITTLMADYIGQADSSDKGRSKSKTYMKRLRRVGQRLQLLARRWGIGVLCLLGAGFTDDLIMTVPDPVFAQFLDIVDRFEGYNIRAVSNAAASVVQLFMNGGETTPKMLIEAVQEDSLQLLPRLSEDMKFLFMVADGV